jgi:hypothetical protein
LLAALRDGSPCSPPVFDQLVGFGRLMHRLKDRPGVPPCNIGDVLVALTALPPEGSGDWTCDPAVDQATFAKLGFAATSRGIVDAERNNHDAWRAHTERCRSFIDAAGDRPERKRCAVVLGVGHAFDVPLAALAQRFERLVLVDVDPDAVERTAEGVRRSEPKARIEAKALDLTGINRAMVRQLDRLALSSRDRATVQKRIEGYVRSYRATPPPVLDDDDEADLVISSCVLSQLAWPQRAYALGRLRELGPVEGDDERSWRQAWFELELRVQQDHILLCSGIAPIAVLISDVANRLTAFDAALLERPSGQKTFTLGADSLLERIPQASRIERHASWLWPRHRPGASGEPGSWMEVEAVVLTREKT